MADQSDSVTSLPDNSRYRVALDLMNRIATSEFYDRGSKDPENPRRYFLELYTACRKVVS